MFGNQRHAAGTAEVETALYFVFVPREESPKASCHIHAMALALVLSSDAEYIICHQLGEKGGWCWRRFMIENGVCIFFQASV